MVNLVACDHMQLETSCKQKLFVDLLLVTGSPFVFFTTKYKQSFLCRLLPYVQVPHILLTLKPAVKSKFSA